LDRNVSASRDIKASIASDHIFGGKGLNDDEYDDGEEDSSDVGANTNGKIGSKEEVEMRTTKPTTTTCPFQRLGLHPNLVSALTSPDGHFRLSQPTIVQSRSISVLLPKSNSNNKKKKKHGTKLEQNLFIQSETGSGKTLAYLIPILQHLAVGNSTATTTPQQSLKRIDRQLGGTRVILLCPTRELSTQTYTIAQQLCTSAFPWIIPGCFSGGEKRKSEKARLRKGITILIATPGRLLDHLSKTECLLSALKNKLEWIILDEADRLLDAGLGGQVSRLCSIYDRINRVLDRGGMASRGGACWSRRLSMARWRGW
jgi:ATP-dependent RNA helicase DDX31/DBP7